MNTASLTDEAFFEALLVADEATLSDLLAHDFLIVDVMSGQVTHRNALLSAIASGELQFLHIARDPAEVIVRQRETTAVLVGRTRMTMRYQDTEVTSNSRYTHVYVNDDGDKWRLLAAQGTPDADARMPS